MKYDYRDEIKTNEWQRKSGHIKERDNYTCQLCGSKEKIVHVHHRYYKDEWHYWEYPDEALITLCEDCHNEEHSMIKNTNLATKKLNETINHARNLGIMYIEIIKAVNSLIPKTDLNTVVHKEMKLCNIQIQPNQKRFVTNDFKTIDDRKKSFLEELSTYGLKYEPDYIQSFAEYWTVFEKKKFRFENESNFLMPVNIANWEEERIKIEKEKEFKKIWDEAEKYAKEQQEGYMSIFEPLIASAKKEIEENAPQVKKQLLEMFYSKAEEMKNIKVKDIIPSFQNRNRTVYDYLVNVNRPAAFADVYKKEQGLSSCFVRNGPFFPRDYQIVETCIGNSGINPKLCYIKAIEKYFNIKLWLPIPFTRKFYYLIDSDDYKERQVLKYLLKYPMYLEMYIEKYNRGAWKQCADLGTIQLLYEANQAFRRNTKKNLERLNELASISLCEFCNLVHIETPNADKDISLKSFLDMHIQSEDPTASLCSILIKPQTEWIQISSLNSSLYLILNKINEIYDFTFFTRPLNQENKLLKLPLELLAQTNGFIFDFCTESFNNGSMTSMLLPEHLQDVDYYYNKIQALD